MEEYIGTVQKDSLGMIKDGTPHQMVEKFTSQKKKEKVRLQKGSMMTGQQLYQKNLRQFR